MIRKFLLVASVTLLSSPTWAIQDTASSAKVEIDKAVQKVESAMAEGGNWADDAYFNATSCLQKDAEEHTSSASLVVASLLTRYATKEFQSDIGVASVQLVSDYHIASLLVNRGNLCLAQALGIKDVEEQLVEEQQLLLSGTSLTKKEVNRHRKIAKNASEKIAEVADSLEVISPEKKQYFSAGVTTYLLGIVQTVRIKQSFDNVTTAAKSTASLGDGKKGTAAIQAKAKSLGGLFTGGAGILRVFTGAPKHISKLVASGNNMVKYSKKYDIKIGEDVTKEFSSVLGFDTKSKKGLFKKFTKAS
jgi:hypothetical protein